MNEVKEIWKDVVGYEGYYVVNQFGIAKSLDREVPDKRLGVRSIKGQNLKNYKDLNGYLFYQLWKNKKSKTAFIHRLLGEAFLCNPENKSDINHKNGVRDDNRLENLEWATRSENVLHGFRSNGRVSAVSKKVVYLKTGKVYNSMTQAAKDLCINISCISACCLGRHNTTLIGGFKFY
jgi:hypothetical protein